MQLPIFQTSDQTLSLMETKWASILNPVLSLPLNDKPSYLTNITLASGNNVINHLLGATPQGWILTDVNAAVSIYRNAAFNSTTLTLNSSGAAIVSLIVF